MDFLKKISGGLKKTSENFSSGLENIFNKSKPARNVLQELEDFMISSDTVSYTHLTLPTKA